MFERIKSKSQPWKELIIDCCNWFICPYLDSLSHVISAVHQMVHGRPFVQKNNRLTITGCDRFVSRLTLEQMLINLIYTNKRQHGNSKNQTRQVNGYYGAVHKWRHAILADFWPPSPLVTRRHKKSDPPQIWRHNGLTPVWKKHSI